MTGPRMEPRRWFGPARSEKRICTGNGTLWWAGGIRLGLARVKALNPDPMDMVLIANDDTSFEDDFLEKAVGELWLGTRGHAVRLHSIY